MNKKKQKNFFLPEEQEIILDSKTFKALFDRYSDDLFGYINSIANDPLLSEDIVQDTFVKLWKNKDKLRLNKFIVGYLYKTAYNTFCDSHRKQKQEFRMLDDLAYQKAMDILDEEESIRATKIAQIKAVIETLPPKTLEVFKMCKYQGYKYQEIADELGISRKTVENQMSRAFSMIRKQIKDKGTFLLFLNIYYN